MSHFSTIRQWTFRNKGDGMKIIIAFFSLFIFSFTVDVTDDEEKHNEVSNHIGDTIVFSGYRWEVKESFGKHTGPGHNYFSGSKDNVYVDSLGKLHLRLTFRNDKWYCPEVRMVNNLGYGKYIFDIDSLITPLDKDIVVGLFLYDRNDSINFHKEIDFEFSQWGKENALNSQFVIQPKEAEAYRYNTDFTKKTRHTIELRKKRLHFKSAYLVDSAKGEHCKTYSKWKIRPEKPYESKNERVSINVWLYRMSEPSNLKEFEIVISKFQFKPFSLAGILNPKPSQE
jgi:hypothetical protein